MTQKLRDQHINACAIGANIEREFDTHQRNNPHLQQQSRPWFVLVGHIPVLWDLQMCNKGFKTQEIRQ